MDKQRTKKQNKSLHLWYRLMADVLNDAGLDMRVVLKPEVSIDWNEKTIKEYIWKPIQKAITTKEHSADLTTSEPTKVWEHINRHFGEKFGVEVPQIPSVEQTENYLKSLEKSL